jgi:hypothetical protein
MNSNEGGRGTNALSKALGTAKQGDCVRGVSSKLI